VTGSDHEAFGTSSTGQRVDRVTLENDELRLSVLTWGTVIQQLVLKDGPQPADVVLGYDDLAGYEGDSAYFGATVGRYANRIAHGRFSLDGTPFELPTNDRGHTLHGGPEGFHRQVWEVVPGTTSADAVTLAHVSPDGSMGFPGALRATCTYRLDGPAVHLEYRATTDAPTVVNLTQHCYFDLSGELAGVDRQELWIDAEQYLPVDGTAIPLGSPEPVAGTAFDFRTPKPVGADLRSGEEQLVQATGYDHCFVLADPTVERPSIRLTDPGTGRVLEVATDQPGVQLYSGNYLDGSTRAKGGRTPRQGDALCLETQRLPDAPNRPELGDVVLRPGEEYVARTTWRFSTG
jgi:aldose 1-epimerase